MNTHDHSVVTDRMKNLNCFNLQLFLWGCRYKFCPLLNNFVTKYEGRLESKERFAIQRYLLIIGKKQNMQVLSHTFTYFSI